MLHEFWSAKVGNIGLLGGLVDKSLPEIRLSSGMTTPPNYQAETPYVRLRTDASAQER